MGPRDHSQGPSLLGTASEAHPTFGRELGFALKPSSGRKVGPSKDPEIFVMLRTSVLVALAASASAFMPASMAPAKLASARASARSLSLRGGVAGFSRPPPLR